MAKIIKLIVLRNKMHLLVNGPFILRLLFKIVGNYIVYIGF